MYLDKLKEELDTKKLVNQILNILVRNLSCVLKKELIKKKVIKSFEFKLYYIRYADDWLIGVWGLKKDATKIRDKIVIFLKES